MKDVQKYFKPRKRDITPIVGYIDYVRRTGEGFSNLNLKDQVKAIAYLHGLALYNLGLVIGMSEGIAKGLESLLQ